MKAMLQKLERYYKRPVDVEFTVELIPKYPKPEIKIYLLQCRPLSNQEWFADVQIPKSVASQDELFHSTHLVPQGVVEKVRYVIYIDPIRYGQIPNSVRMELTRIIGKLNQLLEGETFILMGPGRWGSSNIDLGIKVSYADIYNARMLIEIAMSRNGATPEVSYGTHFFQDLVESRIFPLALYPNTDQSRLNQGFMDAAHNKLGLLMPEYSVYSSELKVIDLPEVSQGRYLRVVMSSEVGEALGYLTGY
jgi:hypothetical protein